VKQSSPEADQRTTPHQRTPNAYKALTQQKKAPPTEKGEGKMSLENDALRKKIRKSRPGEKFKTEKDHTKDSFLTPQNAPQKTRKAARQEEHKKLKGKNPKKGDEKGKRKRGKNTQMHGEAAIRKTVPTLQ